MHMNFVIEAGDFAINMIDCRCHRIYIWILKYVLIYLLKVHGFFVNGGSCQMLVNLFLPLYAIFSAKLALILKPVWIGLKKYFF